jgi:hypothetical protein
MKKENKYAKIYVHNTYILFSIKQAKEGGPQISSANLKSANLRTENSESPQIHTFTFSSYKQSTKCSNSNL